MTYVWQSFVPVLIKPNTDQNPAQNRLQDYWSFVIGECSLAYLEGACHLGPPPVIEDDAFVLGIVDRVR